jgi:hypothetical protein
MYRNNLPTEISAVAAILPDGRAPLSLYTEIDLLKGPSSNPSPNSPSRVWPWARLPLLFPLSSGCYAIAKLERARDQEKSVIVCSNRHTFDMRGYLKASQHHGPLTLQLRCVAVPVCSSRILQSFAVVTLEHAVLAAETLLTESTVADDRLGWCLAASLGTSGLV